MQGSSLKIEGGGFSQLWEVGALEKGKEYIDNTKDFFSALSTATSFTADTEFSLKQKVYPRCTIQIKMPVSPESVNSKWKLHQKFQNKDEKMPYNRQDHDSFDKISIKTTIKGTQF